MTVAVMIKVYDGIVLATDSATTVPLPGGSAQVYNNSNKVFQLHRGLPIGAFTWGLGAIGSASIDTLAKDLRARLMGGSGSSWNLDLRSYTIEEVVNRAVELLHTELYAPIIGDQLDQHEAINVKLIAQGQPTVTFEPPVLGFLVAGYSAGSQNAEAWQIIISDPRSTPTPVNIAPIDAYGHVAFAQTEATERLFGVHQGLQQRILQQVDPSVHSAVQDAFKESTYSPVVPFMPFADAINLARFLVDVTIGFNTYLLGPNTVGGPVEIAAISRHEGFKWISRKHYYAEHLNPRILP